MPARLRNPLLLASLLAALALALGACGGGGGSGEIDEKNAYVREINAAQTEFKQRTDSVASRGVPQTSFDAQARFVQRFGAAIDHVVAKLRSIAAPSDVRTEHHRLVDVMSGFGTDVHQVTQTLRGGNSRQRAAAYVTFKKAQQTVTLRVDAAIDAINSKLAAI